MGAAPELTLDHRALGGADDRGAAEREAAGDLLDRLVVDQRAIGPEPGPPQRGAIVDAGRRQRDLDQVRHGVDEPRRPEVVGEDHRPREAARELGQALGQRRRLILERGTAAEHDHGPPQHRLAADAGHALVETIGAAEQLADVDAEHGTADLGRERPHHQQLADADRPDQQRARRRPLA